MIALASSLRLRRRCASGGAFGHRRVEVRKTDRILVVQISHWMERDVGSAITYFAITNHREPYRRFGIRQADLRSHMAIVGKTGAGKSTLLKSMVVQDIVAGRAVALFDPHGDLVEDVLRRVPSDRLAEVVYLNTPAANWTFNPLSGVPLGQEGLAAAELIEAFKKVWHEDWGPRLEHLLRNVLLTLFEVPGSTLADANRLFNDKDYRAEAARTVSNEAVREFWVKEFAGYSFAFRAVIVAPLQNKLGALLTDPRMNSIITAQSTSFDLDTVMDGKILLVNLSRGKIGEGPAQVLGALLAARIGLSGLARADRPENERRDFHVYLDEFQMFATLSLATMLAELRKYRVALICACQYLAQLDPQIQAAVMGNVGTLVSFRVSAADAAVLARELDTFEPKDFVHLPNYDICLRLMIDGEPSRAFSATTLNDPA